MSWQNPVPPVMSLWSGFAILLATVLLSGVLCYLLLG